MDARYSSGLLRGMGGTLLTADPAPARTRSSRSPVAHDPLGTVGGVPVPAPPPDSPWRIEAFVASLTAASPNTVTAYRGDVAAFVEWAERLGLAGPEGVDRKVLRRYLAYLTTRRYARRTIA